MRTSRLKSLRPLWSVWTLLLIALAALWVRSYWRVDGMMMFLPSDRMQIATSHRGAISLMLSSIPAGRAWAWSIHLDSSQPNLSGLDSVRELFGVGDDKMPLNIHGYGIAVLGSEALGLRSGAAMIVVLPHWLPIAGIVALLWYRVKRERRRLQWAERGYCRVCGYDLRASPERCPECGTEVQQIELEDAPS